MDNALESIGNKADRMEERISKLENGNLEVVQVKEEWELRSKKKNEESLWELTKSFRKGNIRVTVIPKEEREKRGDSLLKEIISETSWTWQGTGYTSLWNLREHLMASMQKDHLQDRQSKVENKKECETQPREKKGWWSDEWEKIFVSDTFSTVLISKI